VTIQTADEVEVEEAPAPSARAAQLARLSPARAALELAWPGIIEQSVSAGGTAIVFAFVGHLGATATAGVGAAGNFFFLMFPVWRSLAIGTIAIVSRRMGEGRPRDAADATRQSLMLGARGTGLRGGLLSVLGAAAASPGRERGGRRHRRALPSGDGRGEWRIDGVAHRHVRDARGG
jgi:hypothetical protein